MMVRAAGTAGLRWAIGGRDEERQPNVGDEACWHRALAALACAARVRPLADKDAARIALATLLLEASIDVNRADADGVTALHLAAADGNIANNYAYAEFLVATAHADVNVKVWHARAEKQKAGWWHASRETDHASRACAASDDARAGQDAHGRTPLHVAAVSGSVATTALLLKHGALVNAADDNGNTALHLAVTAHRTDTVETLLASGASPCMRARWRRRPRRIVVPAVRRRPVARLMQSKIATLASSSAPSPVSPATGANRNTRNGHQQTPMHLAARRTWACGAPAAAAKRGGGEAAHGMTRPGRHGVRENPRSPHGRRHLAAAAGGSVHVAGRHHGPIAAAGGGRERQPRGRQGFAAGRGAQEPCKAQPCDAWS